MKQAENKRFTGFFLDLLFNPEDGRDIFRLEVS
jgi:hypothetical protein